MLDLDQYHEVVFAIVGSRTFVSSLGDTALFAVPGGMLITRAELVRQAKRRGMRVQFIQP